MTFNLLSPLQYGISTQKEYSRSNISSNVCDLTYCAVLAQERFGWRLIWFRYIPLQCLPPNIFYNNTGVVAAACRKNFSLF